LTPAEAEVIGGAVIEERNVVNDVVAVIETPAEDITLNLDSEELHCLGQETNRPTLGVIYVFSNYYHLSSTIYLLSIFLNYL
jgi:hypothetical protein